MNQIINYFSPQKEQSFLERQKTKALIILVFITFLSLVALLIQTIFSVSVNKALDYKVFSGVAFFYF